jgi:hypoxanthine phosphoribosyltransferase
MNKLMLLNWNQFNIAVLSLYQQLSNRRASAIYGQPRGGLPLAVALSHYMRLPLILTWEPGAIWIDDIYDTGKTYQEAANLDKFIIGAVWVTKDTNVPGLNYVTAVDKETWIVFPWEDPKKAEADRLAYLESRQDAVSG